MNKKTIIFYFSQSGNSLYIAKRISAALENVTLVSIPDAVHNNQYKYEDYEKVGFVIPLYFMGMPNMVNLFISKLQLPKNCYTFSIITRAITKGRVIYDIDKLLNKKQIKISYGRYITLPDSYIKWAEGPDKESSFKKSRVAGEMVDLMAEEIINEINYKEKEGFILKLTSFLVYTVWKSRLKSMGKKFKVTSYCSGCSICEQTCPARNIRLENSKPVWSNKCEDCMACVQHCPKKAIYFNSRTANKRRYINPNVQLG